MDIHHSHKYGPFARLYFLAAVLVILAGTAVILRVSGIFTNTGDQTATPNPAPTTTAPTVDEQIGEDIKTEITKLSASSTTIEQQLIIAKAKNWTESKTIYSNQVEAFKAQYPSIANLINIAKNKNKNTADIEKNYDDLKAKVTLAEQGITSNNAEDTQKNLDISLTGLNTLISQISNL